jgi:hypothetical protein
VENGMTGIVPYNRLPGIPIAAEFLLMRIIGDDVKAGPGTEETIQRIAFPDLLMV